MDFELLNAISHLERPDGLIAIPGLPAYVLAVRPTQDRALSRLRRITRQTGPLLLLGVDSNAFAPYLSEIPQSARTLINRHWPGALELWLPACATISPALNDGQDWMKTMQPDCEVLQGLLSMMPEGVLAVCTANRWGEYPATSVQAVFDTFGEDVDFVLSDDDWVRATPSPTVVSVARDGELYLLRSGHVVLD